MEYISEIPMTAGDAASILDNIEKCMNSCDYITGNMVMAIIEMGSVCFLLGNKLVLDGKDKLTLRRETCLAMLNVLVTFASNHSEQYGWFLYWMDKLQERGEELETLYDWEDNDE